MPEEINRVVVDSLADLLWTHSPEGDENLLKEGIGPERIVRVGNITIDCLVMLKGRIERDGAWRRLGVSPGNYGVVTLRHPVNVDDPDTLSAIISTIGRISSTLPMVFPIHPRTRSNIEQFELTPMLSAYPGLKSTAPLGYVHFMNLLSNCRLAVTDSGGLQDEASYLGIPCLTFKSSTSRSLSVTRGTNQLSRPDLLQDQISGILDRNASIGESCVADLWDGRTAPRVIESMRKFICEPN
jgi:UDP-N-acetylglucosamine 2-epimerase (non-hydrolysing)